MSDFDRLFFREFDFERYNCLHFVVDVWRILFGLDVSCLTQGIVQEDGKQSMRVAARFKVFRRIRNLKSPCLCMMHGVATDQTHIATFIDGRVLHLSEVGVQYFPPEVIFPLYKQVYFYEYRHNN